MPPYRNFDELAAAQCAGRDYRITVRRRSAVPVAIIAPHGGSIERRTSHIASQLAGEEFNLYLFEGLDADGSFDPLHITSHRFDEPRCLSLIAHCETVVAVHGCKGDAPCVYVGGRDHALRADVAEALARAGVPAKLDGHAFPGRHPRNICNRGAARRGVQLELTDALRGGEAETAVVSELRDVLLARGSLT